MIVIADTSPLNYLILIEQAELLHRLFGAVIIPRTVFDELCDTGASIQVRNWTQNLPVWIQVKNTTLTSQTLLDNLDDGEKEAILLAQELSADLLLLDDKQGRRAALELGIAITGTIGILDRAAQLGLIDLKVELEKLKDTSFYVSEEITRKLLIK